VHCRIHKHATSANLAAARLKTAPCDLAVEMHATRLDAKRLQEDDVT
jgi:hypothetical protein